MEFRGETMCVESVSGALIIHQRPTHLIPSLIALRCAFRLPHMASIIPLTDLSVVRNRDALDALRRTAATVPATGESGLLDTRGRELHDLRISVTDRCNFRCTYCMPKSVFDNDFQFLKHGDLLSFEEIARIARLFVGLGVRKIRLTGGEPLLRRNIERLVEMLARIDGIDLTLTTNGSGLAKKARGLREAGLQRVTVSLDSLDDRVFRALNDVDFPVARVLEGIDAAAAAGLAPIKVNMVVKRGINEESILPMARHFRGTGHIVRFIEFMDVGATNGWRMDAVVPAADIVRRIDAELPLVSTDSGYRGEVAERWCYRDGGGEIGVIASVTQAFCRDCTRARLSTDGKLYTCLFAQHGHDLRGLVRGGLDDAALSGAIAMVWRQRGDRYSEIRTDNTERSSRIEMSYIGG
jgi:cyclic pyranopterin phosphate synthase